MSDVANNEIKVHLGFWINWSYSSIQGATITLTHQHGAFLVAFLAIFVGVVGKSLWRIFCFALHSTLSSSTSQDGLYHQRQVILRNSTNSFDGFMELVRSYWAWRKKAQRAHLRLVPTILFALLTSVAFGVAGILSSSVSWAIGDEVLISGENCAIVDTRADSEGYLTVIPPYMSKQTAAASTYALQCYGSASVSNSCGTFVKASLPVIIKRDAACPFSEEMCLSNSTNIFLDSGRLDSHYDLGINSPPEMRFQLRYTHHCGPIVTKNYTTIYFADNSSKPLAYMRYHYGPHTILTANSTEQNLTFEYPLNLTLNQAGFSKLNIISVDYTVS